MSVIFSTNQVTFCCDICNKILSGGILMGTSEIIYKYGWVVLPNKHCYCELCSYKYNIVHEPKKTCIIEKT